MLNIYQNKKVFVTGHTGFKGSWLTAVLNHLGIENTGYALPPEGNPNHYQLLNLAAASDTAFANILDKGKLQNAIAAAQPDIIFHLAAQALVRTSYENPVDTYETNVIGTLNVLEAARKCKTVKAIVLITTDKVYQNKEWVKPYAETDELGGYDMYSSSKACCEILISSYRNSFFNINDYKSKHDVLIASARSGNVIGGGDWSVDRLIPDIAVAASTDRQVQIRNPKSVRPWQHVLDCVYGYLMLGEKLLNEETTFAEPWNFSPYSSDVKNVEEIAAIAKNCWDKVVVNFGASPTDYHEAGLLVLDNSKALSKLGWKPAWDTNAAVQKTIEWYKAYYQEGQILTGNHISGYLENIN